MKKFLSLLLAAMMLCSCAVAMAEEPAKKDVSEFAIISGAENFKVQTDLKTAKQSTDLWMQVDASGQIDVTVPLVLVFRTNIDGGEANTGTNYAITNNNNANLVVTDIDVTKINEDTATNPMQMVAWSEGTTPNEDKYMLQITADLTKIDTIETAEPTDPSYDLNTIKHSELAKDGGLFRLNRTVNGTAGTKTDLDAEMVTGQLSFVTTRSDDDTEMLKDYGVKLVTVEYTVAINTQNAVGEEIEDDGTLEGTEYVNGNPAEYTYTYDYEDTDKIKITETKVTTP